MMMDIALVVIVIFAAVALSSRLMGGVTHYKTKFCMDYPDICADSQFTEDDIAAQHSQSCLFAAIASITTGRESTCEDYFKFSPFNSNPNRIQTMIIAKASFALRTVMDILYPGSVQMTGLITGMSAQSPPKSMLHDPATMEEYNDRENEMTDEFIVQNPTVSCEKVEGYPEFEYDEDCRFYNPGCKSTNVWYTIGKEGKWVWKTEDMNGYTKYTDLSDMSTSVLGRLDDVHKEIKKKLEKANKKQTEIARYNAGINALKEVLGDDSRRKDDFITVHRVSDYYEDFDVEADGKKNWDILDASKLPKEEFIKSCTIENFYLPQDAGTLTKWIKAMGDPMYLVYWQKMPKGVDSAWSSKWTTFENAMDVAFAWISFGSVFKIAGKTFSFIFKGGFKNLAKKESAWLVKRAVKKEIGNEIRALVEKGALDDIKEEQLKKLVSSTSKKIIKGMDEEKLKMLGKNYAKMLDKKTDEKIYKNIGRGMVKDEVAIALAKEQMSGFNKFAYSKTTFYVTKNGVAKKTTVKILADTNKEPETKILNFYFTKSGWTKAATSVAKSTDKLSLAEKLAPRFKPILPEIKELWKNRIFQKKTGALTAAAVASYYLDAKEAKETPQADSLVLSLPYEGPVKAFKMPPLEKGAGRNHVMVKNGGKILGMFGTKIVPLYLASPCYADLLVERNPLKCSPFKAAFGSFRNLITIDNCEDASMVGSIEKKNDCYEAQINGDLLTKDEISDKIVELTGIMSGLKRTEGIDELDKLKNNGNDKITKKINERKEKLRIYEESLVDENEKQKIKEGKIYIEEANFDVAHIRDPISGIEFIFNFSKGPDGNDCVSASELYPLYTIYTNKCRIKSIDGINITTDSNLDIISGSTTLSSRAGASDDYKLKLEGVGKCAYYPPPSYASYECSSQHLVYKKEKISPKTQIGGDPTLSAIRRSASYKFTKVDIDGSTQAVYDFMEDGGNDVGCCGGISKGEWDNLAEHEKMEIAAETAERIKICNGKKEVYETLNNKFNSDYKHISFKNMQCVIELDMDESKFLKGVECENGKAISFKSGNDRFSLMTDMLKDFLSEDDIKKLEQETNKVVDIDALNRYCYLKEHVANSEFKFTKKIELVYDRDATKDLEKARKDGKLKDFIKSESDAQVFVPVKSAELHVRRNDKKYYIKFMDTNNELDGIADSISVDQYKSGFEKFKWMIGWSREPKILLVDEDHENNDGIFDYIQIRDCKVLGQIVSVTERKRIGEGDYNFCVAGADVKGKLMRFAPVALSSLGGAIGSLIEPGGGTAVGVKAGDIVGASLLTGYIYFYESKVGREDIWPGKKIK